MTFARCLRLVFAAVLGATVSMTVAGPAYADDARDKMFHDAETAFNAGNYPLAYERFKQLYDQQKSLDVAANLSQVEAKLNKWRDAAEHLAYAVRLLPATAGDDVRNRMIADLAVLELKVGALTIDCPQGTVVTANGKQLGIAPLEVIYVDPGTIAISGRHEERGEGRLEVRVEAGKKLSVALQLKPRDSGRAAWPAVLLGGIAGAGLAVGIAGFVVSAQRGSEGDDLGLQLEQDGVHGCTTNPSRCEPVQAKYDDEVSFRTMGITGVSIGAAAGVGMLIYLLLPPQRPSSNAASLRIAPMPGATGLLLQGAFQ